MPRSVADVLHALLVRFDGVEPVEISRRDLAAAVGWSRNTVRRAVRHLTSRALLTIDAEGQGRTTTTYRPDVAAVRDQTQPEGDQA